MLMFICAVVAGLGSLLGLVSLPALWRGSLDVEPALRSWWLWGAVSRRAAVRASPAAWLSFIVGTCGVWLMLLTPDAPRAVWVMFTAAWGGMSVLAITAALFARPKWIVVPRLRRQPGAVQEWLRARGVRNRV